MIVVEGGDNVGKSTLVEQLVNESNGLLYVMRRQKFSPTAGGTIGQSYLDMLVPGNQGDRPIIFGLADRLLASEHVYGKLFRGGSRLSKREHFLILATLISYNAIIVFCDPPDTAIEASWAEREQLYPHDPLLIAAKYREEMPRIFGPLPVLRYDWTASNATEARQTMLRLHDRSVRSFSLHARLDPNFSRSERLV
jgi:hypothetical protein